MSRFVANARELYEMSRSDSKRSGKSRFTIIQDAIACRKKYGTTVNDYLAFGFSILDEEYREHYLSRNHNFQMVLQVNDQRMKDKWYAFERLREYFVRDVINIDYASDEEIEEFLAKHKDFFAKQLISYGGMGVKHVYSDSASKDDLLAQLRADGLILWEETIKQHAEMNKLNPHAINTVRIPSCRNKNGEVIIFPCIVRVGAGDKPVDNISSGGFYTLIKPDGTIGLDGFYQENIPLLKDDALVEHKHPLTGFNPLGFQIPYFKESVELVKQMAKATPELTIAGWDIAITEKGPDVVEVNEFPGLDINQNFYFTKVLDIPHVGLKSKIEEHLKVKIHNDYRIEYL